MFRAKGLRLIGPPQKESISACAIMRDCLGDVPCLLGGTTYRFSPQAVSVSIAAAKPISFALKFAGDYIWAAVKEEL